MTLYSVLVSRQSNVATSFGLQTRRQIICRRPLRCSSTRGAAAPLPSISYLRRSKYQHKRHAIDASFQRNVFSSLSTLDDQKPDDGSKDYDAQAEIMWANTEDTDATTDEPIFTTDTEIDTSNDLSAPDASTSFETSSPLSATNTDVNASNDVSAPDTSFSFGIERSSQNSDAWSATPNGFDASADNTSSIQTSDLSDLFSADIFSESWQGKSASNNQSRRETSQSQSGKFGMFQTDMFGDSYSDKPRTSSTKEVSDTPIENPSTAVEMRYNDLLQQTNELLDALSGRSVPHTSLQLMDFDKVMAQWAQFHLEVDNNKAASPDATENTDLFDFSIDFLDARQQNVIGQDLKLRASDNCMRLLDALEKNYDDAYQGVGSSNHLEIYPSASSYNHALLALAHSNKGTLSAQEAYFILDRIFNRCRHYRDNPESAASSTIAAPPEPSIITFNSVSHVIAKSGGTGAGFLAEDVFNQMQAWKNECDDRKFEDVGNGKSHQTHLYHGVHPNTRTLASVLDAWANTETVHGQSLVPERTTFIFETALNHRRSYVRSVKGLTDQEDDEVEDEYVDEANELLTFIDSAREGNVLDDDVVEETIDEDVFEESDSTTESALTTDTGTIAEPFLKPNTVAFNTVLNAWSVSGLGYKGAQRAHELLNKVELMSEIGDLDLPEGYRDPTITSFDVVDDELEALTSLKPNVRSYASVMNVWANVASVDTRHGEDAASKCEQILSKMEERGAEDASIRPNLVAYTTCISAWARARNSERAPARAENILNRMIDLYYDEGTCELPTLEGDVANAQHDAPFNAVITAYARSGDSSASDRSLAILSRLEASPVQPTAVTYNAVIDVCAKRGEPDRALALLDRMKERSIQPDPTSYNTIINAFARDETPGSADRVWEFVKQLEEEKLNGQSNFIATKFSYSSVLNSYARASGKLDGGIHIVEKAKQVYDHMIQQVEEGKLIGGSDAFANSSFLNCCANMNGPSGEKRQALVMAINAFEELKKNPNVHGEANQYTYGTMMKVSNRLSSDPEEKTRLMENLFVQACNRGYLSSSVFGQFLKHTSPHVSTKAILAQGGTKRELPSKWYRNVPEKHWPTGYDGPRRRNSDGYQRQRRFANDY